MEINSHSRHDSCDKKFGVFDDSFGEFPNFYSLPRDKQSACSFSLSISLSLSLCLNTWLHDEMCEPCVVAARRKERGALRDTSCCCGEDGAKTSFVRLCFVSGEENLSRWASLCYSRARSASQRSLDRHLFDYILTRKCNQTQLQRRKRSNV